MKNKFEKPRSNAFVSGLIKAFFDLINHFIKHLRSGGFIQVIHISGCVVQTQNPRNVTPTIFRNFSVSKDA